MPISSPLPNDPATKWASAVVEGRTVAGGFVRAACERHLRDLRDGAARGLYWNAAAASHRIGFFPAVLSVTAGAAAGKPFALLPWHEFVVGSLYGWFTADGRRRFRHAWLETGKGQAKSPLMAAIGLLEMGFLGVPRAEVYAIGQDKRTANVLFMDAVAMCRAPIPGGEESDTLANRGEVIIRGAGDNAWRIEHPDSGSKFQSLANGEAVSGPRPTAVLADEIHEFKEAGSLETWRRAIAKMPGDAIMILGTNTPASTQLVGTEYSDLYQRIAKGEVEDDSGFSFIARVDPTDDPLNDESCWIKSLPALGITYPIENIRREVVTARTLLSTALSVKRLYFGIPVGQAEFFIAEEAWNAVQGEVYPEDLRGLPCWLSLDLSQKNDLTALTGTWRDTDGHLLVKTWYFTTQEGLAEREIGDKAPYARWVEAGLLEAVPGPVIDKEFVAAKVQEIVTEHEVQFLAFDAAGMPDFEAACARIGFAVWRYKGPDERAGQGLKLIGHAQGTRVVFEDRQLCMPRSIERLEDRILLQGDAAAGITIDESPVTKWCAGNARVVADAQKNRAFDKARSRGRIDGLVTIAMGVGAADSEIAAANANLDDFLSSPVHA
jgi:phage terminase large subunit-like protein